MENVEQIISELDEYVKNAKKTVFSGSDITLNRSKMLEFVDRLRTNLPDVIREAQYVMQESERLKDNAYQQAQKIVTEAERRAKAALDESDIIAAAKDEAEKIRENAYAYRDKLEYDARVKVDQLLADSEMTISDALMVIRKNREELRETSRSSRPSNGMDNK